MPAETAPFRVIGSVGERLWLVGYQTLMTAALPVLLARLFWRGRRTPAYREDWLQRLGLGPAVRGANPVWIHAVSVGETVAAVPIVEALLRAEEPRPVLITSTTPTGAERVRTLFGGRVMHRLLPYDQFVANWLFLRRVHPEVAVFMETELWPALYACLRRRRVPTLVLNARLSDKSARGYRRVRGLVKPLLQGATAVAAQSRADAERLLGLGAIPSRLEVTGSLKFDIAVPEAVIEQAELLRSQWLLCGRPLWVAASTHEGEEVQVLAAHRNVLAERPDSLLILVPRHPERFDRVMKLCEAEGFKTVRRSTGQPVDSGVQVLLGDSMGELLLWYQLADLAFVGGSLVRVGGHNPLEPAACGRPVLWGPWVFNFARVDELLDQAGASVRVADGAALAATLRRLFDDPAERTRMGAAGLAVVAENQGAAGRMMQMLEAAIHPLEKSRQPPD